MSCEKKFENFTSHVEGGHMIGIAAFGACAMGIVAARQLAYFHDMVLLGTIAFGALLVGILAAAAAGKVLNDRLDKDLPKEKRKDAVNSFNCFTLAGGFVGMFASAPILFFSKMGGEEHLPEILLVMTGCILAGALVGAAFGLHKAGKITAQKQPASEDEVNLVSPNISGQIQ